jgi:hypothetical protein
VSVRGRFANRVGSSWFASRSIKKGFDRFCLSSQHKLTKKMNNTLVRTNRTTFSNYTQHMIASAMNNDDGDGDDEDLPYQLKVFTRAQDREDREDAYVSGEGKETDNVDFTHVLRAIDSYGVVIGSLHAAVGSNNDLATKLPPSREVMIMHHQGGNSNHGSASVLISIFVKHDWRRSRVGTELVKELFRTSPGRTWLVSIDSAEARPFFSSVGFAPSQWKDLVNRWSHQHHALSSSPSSSSVDVTHMELAMAH